MCDAPSRLQTLTSAMQRALMLASQGRGCVEPNPLVGAVLHDGTSMVAEGFHARFGDVHAEVAALADARAKGVDPRGLTMVVTLEPCSHQGKQPPCVQALLDAGIGRVVAAMQDPDPRVAGSGFAQLRAAGVQVEVGLCEEQARTLNAPFLRRIATGLPWVTLKWAQTLDGCIATRTGQSRWISGPQARQRVHQWRAAADAVVVGIGTALADNPQLTAREVTVHRHALRVVVDPDLQMSPGAAMLHDGGPPVVIASRTWEGDCALSARQQALAATGAIFQPLECDGQGDLILEPLLRWLVQAHQATHVLVEGGAGLHARLLGQGLVDAMEVFIAPKALGDDQAIHALRGFAPTKMEEALIWRLANVEQLDQDVLLSYRRLAFASK